MDYSFRSNFAPFREGMRDGAPIGAGYFAVSFALGIAASRAGLTPVQGFLASLLCNASAGDYAAFTSIAARATLIEIALVLLIANARYVLMSSAMTQRLAPDIPMIHRLLIAYDVTDELFAIAISRPGYLNPWYSYGSFITSMPCWALGTALGAWAGGILPMRLVSALSVALYGMFIAIVIPAARDSRTIAGIVTASFALSHLASVIPGMSGISGGTRTIILTIIICGIAAKLFPHTSKQAVDSNRSREPERYDRAVQAAD